MLRSATIQMETDLSQEVFELWLLGLIKAMSVNPEQSNILAEKPECVALEARNLTIPGYYWWLPECAKSDSEKFENWSIKMWHPLDSSRPKNGLFIGPIVLPENLSDILIKK